MLSLSPLPLSGETNSAQGSRYIVSKPLLCSGSFCPGFLRLSTSLSACQTVMPFLTLLHPTSPWTLGRSRHQGWASRRRPREEAVLSKAGASEWEIAPRNAPCRPASCRSSPSALSAELSMPKARSLGQRFRGDREGKREGDQFLQRPRVAAARSCTESGTKPAAGRGQGWGALSVLGAGPRLGNAGARVMRPQNRLGVPLGRLVPQIKETVILDTAAEDYS